MELCREGTRPLFCLSIRADKRPGSLQIVFRLVHSLLLSFQHQLLQMHSRLFALFCMIVLVSAAPITPKAIEAAQVSASELAVVPLDVSDPAIPSGPVARMCRAGFCR
ncbi:hypothetical protein C8J56DRAFT_1158094 [Mycena floridula]|nr:hypothetical protein C8J56DRAFT_1158094 [Mycena floridula]